MHQVNELERPRLASFLARAKTQYVRHEKFVPAISFTLGIAFDVLTLGRIDRWSIIVQLGLYLAAVQSLLFLEAVDSFRPIKVPGKLALVWKYRDDASHFLLGSLLSAFTLFFVKSASLMASAAFLMIVTLALIGNELSAARQFGTRLRAGLFALALASYACCLAPLGWGGIGTKPFALGMGLAAGWLTLTTAALAVAVRHGRYLLRQLAVPFALVIATFISAHALRLIPPVPLAIKHMGIYRSVEHTPQGYRVSMLKPSWRLWEQGDQKFIYRSGDRVYCFFSVFSPGGFKEKLKILWMYKDPRQGWQTADIVPLTVIGGREEGYRAFTYKQNFHPGQWQVRVETSDGREIGRLSLKVEMDTSFEERRLRFEQL